MNKLVNISSLSKILNLIDPKTKTQKLYFKTLGERI